MDLLGRILLRYYSENHNNLIWIINVYLYGYENSEPGLRNELAIFSRQIQKNSLEQIEILGTSGVAAAWGLHYYLKNYCYVHISWEGNQLELPNALPDVCVNVTSNDRLLILILNVRYLPSHIKHLSS